KDIFKKANVKDYNYYKIKMLLAMKDSDEQVLLAEDQAWMESSSDSDQEINASMVFMAQIEKVLSESDESSLFAEKTIVEEERYEYMIRYSTLYDNDKQQRKKIGEQKILFDKMSCQLVEINNNVLRLQEKILEKEMKISELEGCVSNKDVEIEKYLERLNESKDLRPTLYDEKVIGLGYTPMFFTHSHEDLEIEKFKRSRENKIEFAYDYGNLNASYVNEKIIFEDDYFKEIINPDFEKIDSPFQQTSSLKPYVSNVIFEKIITDLEDKVVNLLEKDKVNMETIESLKSKGFESSKNVSSELENQTENDCLVVEKEYDKEENPKVIAPGMFKLNVSKCVSPISMSKSSCDSNNVEIKLKRKRHFEKIDSPFQQTSLLKPYVPNVILEKIIIDLEDEVMSLLEKEKANLETIESLKSKGFVSSENAISETENQSENDCQEVEKECDYVENPKVIAPGMFKLSVS
nr:hypothetical protein [Tanacetum cinerariifolium]